RRRQAHRLERARHARLDLRIAQRRAEVAHTRHLAAEADLHGQGDAARELGVARRLALVAGAQALVVLAERAQVERLQAAGAARLPAAQRRRMSPPSSAVTAVIGSSVRKASPSRSPESAIFFGGAPRRRPTTSSGCPAMAVSGPDGYATSTVGPRSIFSPRRV